MLIPVARILLLSLWVGGGVFLAAVATPSVFAAAPDRTIAGTIAGVMIARWYYVALLAPALLLGLEWREGLRRGTRVGLLTVAVLASAAQVGVDLKLRSIRNDNPAGMSLLSPDDPVRRTFGALHGVSAGLFALQLVCAIGALVGVARDQTAGRATRASDSV